MNVIILAENRERYASGYYHQDIINAFKRKANCHLYGKGYLGYNRQDTIGDVIAKSPFGKSELDLVVVGTSWELEDPDIEESDPHPNINVSELDILKMFFLNKNDCSQ